ncbi:MAG: hypothetical protein KA223_02495 [Candidatus Accumulibacter sp.]|nr:hypothetical protein [Accumulibacter sp.]
MRDATAKKIDSLHAKIASLIEAEIQWTHEQQPARNNFLQSIADTRIKLYCHDPMYREQSRIIGVAAFPKVGER